MNKQVIQTKQDLNTAVARFDFFSYLIGSLEEWKILDPEEQKKAKSIIAAANRYRKYISETIQDFVENNDLEDLK